MVCFLYLKLFPTGSPVNSLVTFLYKFLTSVFYLKSQILFQYR
uniref:Uncharacterized protein n=1 Tax=Arundo donax TaxID=35708 RepID=A0A0A8YYQ5_ARUDO